MNGGPKFRATLIVNQKGKVIGFSIPADITESGNEAYFALAGADILAREVRLVEAESNNSER